MTDYVGLTDDQVAAIRERISAGERRTDLALEFGVSRSMMTRVGRGL